MEETLKKAPKMIAAYKKLQAKAAAAAAECDKAGENATFFQHQNKNLLSAEAETAFQNVVKIMGGFVALDNSTEGAKVLLQKFRTNVKLSRLNEQIRDLDGEIAFHEAVAKELQEDSTVKNPAGKIAKALKSADTIRAKKEKLLPQVEQIKAVLKDDEKAVADLKSKYADNEEFCKYEAMLDNGIDLSRLKYNEMRLLRKDI